MPKELWLWEPNDSEVHNYRISKDVAKLKRHITAMYEREIGVSFTTDSYTGKEPNLVWVHDKDGDEIGLLAKVEVML